jgi:dTDP-4-amino-4,6-dideoxygalactose transaminase
MSMSFIDLAAQQRRIRDKIDAAIAAVLDSGAYVMGPQVREFEAKLAAFGQAEGWPCPAPTAPTPSPCR